MSEVGMSEVSTASLRVSLVQDELVWHDPAANRTAFARRLAELEGETDLIVLPEMFTTGFTMEPEAVAEDWETSATLGWMQEQAAMLDAALTGSVVMREDGQYFNRLLFVTPDGAVSHYDKRHLFRMAREHESYAPGMQRVTLDYRGWRILLQVCYDLRFFGFFSRNRGDYDGPYVANWLKPRRTAWLSLAEKTARHREPTVLCGGGGYY
ncbi:MAG: nitrilase-related carbon-nitrogen hydrolase [Thiolinea sp.]